MADMKKNQKTMLYVGIGAVVLYLLYRYYESQSGASSATGTPATDGSTDGSDYASLAGQEQSDVAALQGQNSTLAAQLAALTGQESSDVSGLQANQGALQAALNALQNAASTVAPSVVSPAGTGGGGKKTKKKLPKLTAKGAIRARSGAKKPPAKMGYKVKGLGAGNWEYVLARAAKPTTHNTHKVNAPKKHPVTSRVAPPPKAKAHKPKARGRR